MSRSIKFLWIMLFVLSFSAACTRATNPAPTTVPVVTDNPDTPASTETPLPVAPEDQPSDSGNEITGQAAVENIEIMILESFPVQVRVRVTGNLPDGCTEIAEEKIERLENIFNILVTTSRPVDLVCTEALVPFEMNISLDVLGLPAGDYTVNVNGIAGSFSLAVDNIVQDEPETIELDISGKVFHDLCAVGEDGANPSAGCIETADGGFQANAVAESDEPGIADVLVTLGEGGCPSIGLAAVTTAQDGRFTFAVNVPGTYCISIDPQIAENSSILIPGAWTIPTSGIGEQSINLTSAEDTRQEILFGWDFQFLPEPIISNDPDCTNQARFVEDVTVPDNTEIQPGRSFEKIWRLQNTGTCTWTTNYQVIFDEGEQMGTSASINLPQSVDPQKSVDVRLQLTAPNELGTHRSDWKLMDETGNVFGLGKNNDSFWVQIVVPEVFADLNLGSPDWTDTFTNASNWFLLNSLNTKFTVDQGRLKMVVLEPGGNEEWGLANQPDLDDFYLEVQFTTGDQCSGLDRYGLLVRAPEPSQGYVFGIGCNGSFRLYKWDGQYTPLQAWKQSASINAGPEQTNTIGFMAKGKTLSLYANGNLIGEFEDVSFTAGQFGLLIGSSNTENLVVYVEDVKYWRLDD